MLRTRASILAPALLALLGCQQPEREPPKPPPVSPTSCKDYAERVCTQTTHGSPTCKAFKEVTELMPADACAAALTQVDFTLAKIADKRQKCTELVDRLCKDLGAETESCNMVKTSTPSLSVERCTEMLGRYAEVLKPLALQEQKKKPLSAEQIARLSGGASAPAFGPADAKVTVVEFLDFECPYSARASSTIHSVVQKYGQQARFVFRQFPLPMHRNARLAAEAALAAHAQGKFWAFHDKAFDNQTQLGRDKLDGYAKEAGLNVAQLNKALDDKTFAEAVDADLKLGEEIAVERTPALYVNGKRVQNPGDPAAVEQAIEEALKTAS